MRDQRSKNKETSEMPYEEDKLQDMEEAEEDEKDAGASRHSDRTPAS